MIIEDAPIKNCDADRLNRVDFANKIANIIKNSESSKGLCFGIYGKWGSGKTSILNMITEYLRDNQV